MPRRRQLFFEARQTEQMARRTERRRALARTPCLASAYTKGALRRLSSFYLLFHSPSFATGRPSYAQGRMDRVETALPATMSVGIGVGESASVRCRVGSYMAAEAPTARVSADPTTIGAPEQRPQPPRAQSEPIPERQKIPWGYLPLIDSLCALSGWELQPTWRVRSYSCSLGRLCRATLPPGRAPAELYASLLVLRRLYSFFAR